MSRITPNTPDIAATTSTLGSPFIISTVVGIAGAAVLLDWLTDMLIVGDTVASETWDQVFVFEYLEATKLFVELDEEEVKNTDETMVVVRKEATVVAL